MVESTGPPELPEESAGALESTMLRTAVPSADANASVSADVESVNRPEVMTVIAPIVASECVVVMLIAMAAATDTPPADVAACGVAGAPAVPPPPVVLSVALAKLRSAATD